MQITKNGDTYKYAIDWSPDSKKILWSDKKLRLQYVDIDTKKVTQVDYDADWEFTDYSWSPDSKWITYARPTKDMMTTLYIYELASQNKAK